MNEDYKIGDRVVCINSSLTGGWAFSGLTTDKEYLVVDFNESYIMICDDYGDYSSYLKELFENIVVFRNRSINEILK